MDDPEQLAGRDALALGQAARHFLEHCTPRHEQFAGTTLGLQNEPDCVGAVRTRCATARSDAMRLASVLACASESAAAEVGVPSRISSATRPATS
jgi:hypothetical protein